MKQQIHFVILATIFFELRNITSLPATMPLSLDDVGENQGLHANWKNKRIHRRGFWDSSPEADSTLFAKQTVPGFYGPKEFAKYYANKFVAPYDQVDTTPAPVGIPVFPFIPFFTWPIVYPTTITPTRGRFYHEIYWQNGHRIMFTPFALDRNEDKSMFNLYYWHLIKDSTDTKNIKNESFYCHNQCSQVFIDWGPVCGARLKTNTMTWNQQTELHQWNYEFRSFVDYCDLQKFNCAYKFWCFAFVMRGRCPDSFIAQNHVKWSPSFLHGDVDEIRQNANDKVPYLDNVEKFALTWFPGTYNKFSDNTAGFGGSNITWWVN